jgi:hypothetical protein
MTEYLRSQRKSANPDRICLSLHYSLTGDHYPANRCCQAMSPYHSADRNFLHASCNGNSIPLSHLSSPTHEFEYRRNSIEIKVFPRFVRRNFLQSPADLRLRQIKCLRIVSLHFMCVTSASFVLQQNKLTLQINPTGNPV